MLGLFISWVYKQAVVHEDEEKNIMADRKEYSPDNRTKKTSPQKWVTVFQIFVVSMLFSVSSGLGSSPSRGQCVVFLGKTLKLLQCLSLRPDPGCSKAGKH